MSIAVTPWNPPDPSGAVNAYLRGVAIAQQREQMDAKRNAQMAEIIGKNVLARSNQQRLDEAAVIRRNFAQTEADRRYELANRRLALQGRGKTGATVEPFVPLPESSPTAPGESLVTAPAEEPATGARLALQQPFDPGAMPLAPATLAEPPAAPDVPGGLPSDLVLTPPASMQAAPMTLEGTARFDVPAEKINGAEAAGVPGDPLTPPLPGEKWTSTPGEVALIPPGIPGPGDVKGSDIALSPAQARAINLLGKQDPKLARQALKEITVAKAKAEGKVSGGVVGTSARVKENFKGSDGNLYVEMADGSWKDGKAPPEGVTVSKVGATAPQPSLQDQITRDGYSYVDRPGFENVVTNKAGTALLVAKQSASGRAIYEPYKSADKIQKLDDGRVVRIRPGGEVETIANAARLSSKESGDFTEVLKKEAAARDAATILETARQTKGEFALTNPGGVSASRVKEAQEKLAVAEREVKIYRDRFPSLSAPPPPPAAGDAKDIPTVKDPATGKDEIVFKSADDAKRLGRKPGDVVWAINPATGLPARAYVR